MSPRRKPVKQAPQKMSFAGTLLTNTGQLISKYPSIVGGGTAFVIIFSFIASNALYYQSGAHPAPILNMRGPQMIVSGSTRPNRDVRQIQNGQDNVKTFKVTHSDDLQTASVKNPVPSSSGNSASGISIDETEQSLSDAPNVNTGDDLVRSIQAELAGQDLYLDVVDGLTGPNTSNAIKSFQEKMGLDADGVPSRELLSLIQNARAPKGVATSKPIRQTQVRQDVASLESGDTKTFNTDMVRLIQIGLSQSAYPHVEVDGLIGSQTRDAIAQFEKHYRLPVTGLPNKQVLNKLESIGAF
tara:strand:- start:1327 stop:2223 length:897 start_codon:yes stop_codon:yes gene_type:complete